MRLRHALRKSVERLTSERVTFFNVAEEDEKRFLDELALPPNFD